MPISAPVSAPRADASPDLRIADAAPPARVTLRTHLSLALLALVYIFSFIDRQALAILIEPIKREFGASDTAIGMLSGLAFAVLYAGLGVPVGKLADRSNRRNIVAVCCALWSLATLGCGMAVYFWQLLAARMGVAIGEAGGMAPSVSLVSDMYPPRQRSFVISLFMMGPNLGVLVGMAAGGWIAQHFGWRHTFLWFGGPGLVLALLVRLFVREPGRGQFEAVRMAAAADTAATPPVSFLRQLLDLWRIPALRYLCLACGVAGVPSYAYGIWATSFLVRTYGVSLAEVGLMFGLTSGVGAIAGALFSGALADRLVVRDRRWQLALPMIGVALGIPSVLAFLLWPATGVWTIGGMHTPHALVFAMLFSFFAAWFPALSYSAMSQLVRAHERGVASALLNLFITLFGVGCGPFVAGVLSDALAPTFGAEALRYSLVATMGLYALTVGCYALALNPYRRRLEALGA
ncbi:putative L-galactonate transporter [Pandoraea terrae]|uniref:Putative L-galactonate transporter n=1 Tax=Pandoraea terrae TaxID=1537710 RepID=A0A5E4UC09_9BURK|nr:MFS transporter [Pandoraea terrae]VVD97587.1 putative L-galactonate transporter [Pandoraea terrae]